MGNPFHPPIAYCFRSVRADSSGSRIIKMSSISTVMVAEEVAKGHIGFNLRFTKTRRRKPSNAEDFKEVYIELRDGAWFHREPEEAPTGRPNKSEEIAMKALRQANLDVDGDVPESAWRKCAYQLGISDSDNEDSRRARSAARVRRWWRRAK
jgi:hypothetical protein